MFERYIEKARRTIFFARYEASQFGSLYIETEYLLLGLLREKQDAGESLPSYARGRGVDPQTDRGSHDATGESVDLSGSAAQPGMQTRADIWGRGI